MRHVPLALLAAEVEALRRPPADGPRVLEAMEALLRAQHLLEARAEALGVFAKEQKRLFERAERQAGASRAQREQFDEEIRKTFNSLGELRKLEREIEAFSAKRRAELQKRCAELAAQLDEHPAEEEVLALEAENEAVKNEIQARLDGFRERDQHWNAQMAGAEQLITELRNSALQKYEVIQRQMTERQSRKIEGEVEKSRARELRSTIGKMFLQTEGYFSFFVEKHKQYHEYVKNIHILLEKVHAEFLRKNGFEEKCAVVNKVYLSLFQENAELGERLRAEQEKTDALKKKCKELQEMRK